MSQVSKTAAALMGSGKFTELRQRLLFLLGAMVIYRLGTYLPVPGVDSEAMLRFMEQQQGTIVDLFNMFSGGALERFSLFALNVMPYISASIIMQMCTQIFPTLKAIQKEGESGRRKITQYTRIGTIGLAIFQSYGVAFALQSQGGGAGIPIVMNPGPGFLFTAVVSLTAGTMFLMWLGEQVTERGVGNGISIIITAGIIAGLPGATIGTLELARNGELGPFSVMAVLALVLLITAFCVFVELGQRRITVNYARRQGGRQAYMNQSSHLPLKLNMSGVIPPIFASSIIMFPATASSWFAQGTESRWLQDAAAMLAPGEPLHLVLYGLMIACFTFFYTAHNLKKSGALIPGIRPGKATAEYVDAVLTRLTFWGCLYLVAVCLVPEFFRQAWAVPFYFGGTSLLIVVVVVMDFMAQLQAHLMSHQYESLMKKSNLKGGSRGGFARG